MEENTTCTNTDIMFNKESLEALVRLIVPMIISIGTVFGWTLDANVILNVLLSVAAVASAVYMMWWKNNNLTRAAQESQETLDKLKECKHAAVETPAVEETAEVEITEGE